MRGIVGVARGVRWVLGRRSCKMGGHRVGRGRGDVFVLLMVLLLRCSYLGT